jgi:hypothetical protein
MVRQVLANKGTLVFNELVTANNNKDLQAFNAASEKFLHMIKLTDDLLNTDQLLQAQHLSQTSYSITGIRRMKKQII